MNHERHDDGDALRRLAEAFGVATSYDGIRGRVEVSDDSVRAVLAAMGHPADSHESVGALLEGLDRTRRQRLLPPSVVVRRDAHEWRRLPLNTGVAVEARVLLENGERVDLEPATASEPTIVELPEDVPLGYHRIEVAEVDRPAQVSHLVVAPLRCPFPEDLPPAWGWALQLYAVRSRRSWGIGDLHDLGDFARHAGRELRAAFLVCNPLHAAAPVLPQEPSPYYPTSRLFTNPLYLRVSDVGEYSLVGADARAEIDALAAAFAERNRDDRLDRDAVATAKMTALTLLHASSVDSARAGAFTRYRAAAGRRLEDFATFCALAERHGVPYQQWPADLRHPGASGIPAARRELAERVRFHAWLQWLCDEQLADAQRAASESGMRIGVVHDLAVGVDKGGADAWALQDDLAQGVSVGAPPDDFNQQGQDWQLPALLPQRLLETGFAPFRDMLGSVLAHAGGIRIDHVLGLFRLFWVPDGRPASEGTYVRYPAEELLGVLALEAHRADAVVVGEDLGTVGPGVRSSLQDAGVLGCAVLYFERDHEGRPRPREHYREQALASVNTHDLPTAAGWWTGEGLRAQLDLGLLDDETDVEAEQQARAQEREALESLLRDEGLLGEDPTVEERVEAMHAFLGATPSRLVAVALQDAVGDRRQPNLPGTVDAYPNWRLPVAEPTPQGARPILLEEFRDHPRLRRLVAAVRSGRAQSMRLGISG